MRMTVQQKISLHTGFNKIQNANSVIKGMAPFYKEFGDLKGKEKYGPWGKGVYI